MESKSQTELFQLPDSQGLHCRIFYTLVPSQEDLRGREADRVELLGQSWGWDSHSHSPSGVLFPYKTENSGVTPGRRSVWNTPVGTLADIIVDFCF